jgi:hypothetical protein
MNRTPELNDFEPLIHAWAERKGLLNSTPMAQFAKLVEEYGETCEAINDHDWYGIKDGIGDCTVVLTIICKLCGYSLVELACKLGDAAVIYDNEKSARSYNIYLGKIASNICRAKPALDIATSCAVLYNQLGILARNCSLDIGECVEYAYNEIKNREGRVVDGVLIKNE